MSTTSTGGAGGAARERTAPSKASAASSSPDTTSGSMPSRARTPATKASALRASRVADVAQKRTLVAPWSRIRTAYSSSAANARSSAAGASSPVRSTPSPSRTIRISRTATSGSAPISSLIVLVPQSIAATTSVTGVVTCGTHGPSAHQSPSSASTSSPSGFTPWPWASDCAGQDVQALDPVGHPAGGDALDLRHVEPGLPRELGAGLEVALVRHGGTPPPAPASADSRSCICFISPDPSRVPMRDAARGQVR